MPAPKYHTEIIVAGRWSIVARNVSEWCALATYYDEEYRLGRVARVRRVDDLLTPENVQAAVDHLRAQGWTQADFAAALGRLLTPSELRQER